MNASSTAARLGALLVDCPEALVSLAARREVERLGATLDPLLTDLALECHLASDGERVDLTTRIHPSDRERVAAATGSSRLRSFLEGWATPGSALGAIPFVDLEYDLDGRAGEPWIGPTIEPRQLSGVGAIHDAYAGKPVASWDSYRAANAMLELLSQESRSWQRRLLACFEALPAYGCINHLGFFRQRGDGNRDAIRLVVSTPRRAVSPFLRSVGWSGDDERFAALLDRFAPYAGRVDFDLDVERVGAGPRISFYLELWSPRPASSALRQVLDDLVTDAWLSPRAARGLREWVAASNGRPARFLTLKVLEEPSGRQVKAYLGDVRAIH